MGIKYLIDTNVAIAFLNNQLPESVAILLEKDGMAISVITRMELLAWRNATPQQIKILETFIQSINVFALDEQIILKGIENRKSYPVKLPDAIIAATAMVNNCILVTRNTKDFKKIESLAILNPWEEF